MCGLIRARLRVRFWRLVVQRVENGGDMLDALHEIKTAWKVPRQNHLQNRLQEEGFMGNVSNGA